LGYNEGRRKIWMGKIGRMRIGGIRWKDRVEG